MWEFLQTYGIWILFIVFFVLMMRMHGMGGGCGMGHDEHSNRQRAVPLRDEYPDAQRTAPRDEYADTQQAVPLEAEYSDAEPRALVRDEYPGTWPEPLARKGTGEEEKAVAERYSSRHHSRGC